MNALVIDASAGVEMVAGTRRSAVLAKLLPAEAEGWVLEHFYAEVFAVLRTIVPNQRKLTDSQATAAVNRLGDWHLHHASVASLVPAA